MADPRTLAAYAAALDRYKALAATDHLAADRAAFLARLPAGGRVLDLGCGPGHDAAAMARAGFAVDAWDATPEMAAEAARHPGVTARCARFADLDARALYDGIWASFSLLHAPRADLPAHFAAITRALKPGGPFYLALKLGEGSSRDALDRLYTYVTQPEVTDMLDAAGLTVQNSRTGTSTGMAGHPDPYIAILAHA